MGGVRRPGILPASALAVILCLLPQYTPAYLDGGGGAGEYTGFIVKFRQPPIIYSVQPPAGIPHAPGAPEEYALQVAETHERALEEFSGILGKEVSPTGPGCEDLKPAHANASFSRRVALRRDFRGVFNGMALDITQEEADRLMEESAYVEAVYPDGVVSALLSSSVPQIKAPSAWRRVDAWGRNITGANVTIAVVDTGIDYMHADLGGCGNFSSTHDYGTAAILCRNTPCNATDAMIGSRDNIYGRSEANQPNTVESTCRDGSYGDYMYDESLDSLVVRDLTHASFTGNDTVNVTLRAYCWMASADRVNVAYYSPLTRQWIPKYSQICAAAGFNNFSAQFNLDDAEGLHVVRGIILYSGSNVSTCGGGGYDDNDDVVLNVSGSPAPEPETRECRVIGGYDFANNDADPLDDHGHGTHCAGIAAGNGTYNGSFMGVAPQAKLYAFKVLDSGGYGSFSDVIAGIERAADLDGDSIPCENDADHVDVISMSLGGSGNPDDAVSQAVDAASQCVVVVVAAGNSGPYSQSVGSPGCARNAVTVGASCLPGQVGTDGYCSSSRVTEFSSRGPVVWAGGTLVKPDVVAPGHLICAARLPGFTPWNSNPMYYLCGDMDHYVKLSGTSMATPHVAGVAALYVQAHPAYTPAQIKDLIRNATQGLGLDANTQGTGEVDILYAFNRRAPNLTGFSAEPAVGRNGTYTFTFDYSDAENDTPTDIRVFVDGAEDVPDESDPSDTDYTGGKQYTYSTYVEGVGEHAVWANTSDMDYTSASGLHFMPLIVGEANCTPSAPPESGDWSISAPTECRDSWFLASADGRVLIQNSSFLLTRAYAVVNSTYMVLEDSSSLDFAGGRVKFM
jgi:subtilisin family serine protease